MNHSFKNKKNDVIGILQRISNRKQMSGMLTGKSKVGSDNEDMAVRANFAHERLVVND